MGNLPTRLRALADKLNQMWGKSPDADLIREGARAIDADREAIAAYVDALAAQPPISAPRTRKGI